LIRFAASMLSSGGTGSPRSRSMRWMKAVMSRPASGMCRMQEPMT
jgi:hypothetical protein